MLCAAAEDEEVSYSDRKIRSLIHLPYIVDGRINNPALLQFASRPWDRLSPGPFGGIRGAHSNVWVQS